MKKGRPVSVNENSFIPVPECGCWIWEGAVSSSGYGNKYHNGIPMLAHRYVYERVRGEIPDGMQLNHKCDTKLCVNPDHMSVGTQKENVADMDRRGRRNQIRKLSTEQARRVKFGGENARALSCELGITVTCINYIRSGETYRWLTKDAV